MEHHHGWNITTTDGTLPRLEHQDNLSIGRESGQQDKPKMERKDDPRIEHHHSQKSSTTYCTDETLGQPTDGKLGKLTDGTSPRLEHQDNLQIGRNTKTSY